MVLLLTRSRNMHLHEQTRPEASSLQRAFYGQMLAMGAQTHPLGRLLTWTPWYRARISKNNRVIHNTLEPQIRKKLNLEVDRMNNSKSQTLMDVALLALTSGSSTTLPEAPDESFIEILISNIKSFIFAGHDTLASTICFLVKCLEDNPECLETLRAEHDSVLGKDVDSAATRLQEAPHILNSLHYTLAVIKEVLRIYPLASTMREGQRGFYLTVPGSSIQYPTEGAGLWLSTHWIQTSPDYWPEANKFRPERWLVEEGHPLRPMKDTWIPFSAGSYSRTPCHLP